MSGDEQARSWMRQALTVAAVGLAAGEAPIGSILILKDGRVIGSGHNNMHRTGNRILHAELVALNAAAGKMPKGNGGLTMVSTLEPCVMCTGAAMEAGVERIIYGLQAPADSGTGRVRAPTSPGTSMPIIQGGVMSRHSRELFLAWMAQHVDDPSRASQQAFIKQLLSLDKVT